MGCLEILRQAVLNHLDKITQIVTCIFIGEGIGTCQIERRAAQKNFFFFQKNFGRQTLVLLVVRIKQQTTDR